ncbi:MAG: glycosyltransferase family 2 protein [Fibrobacteres bacterium]|nr:glycosyltransferase family 2 protein [Fibrobacterota bacterium]
MANSNLKVSILIPSYNQSKYLIAAIDSALQQDYENLEVIVSDNCSTDDTLTHVSRYTADNRFKFYRNEENIGMGANAHKLFSYAKGDFALFLPGDDLLLCNEFISDAVRIIETYPSIVAVFGKNKTLFDDTGKMAESNCNYPAEYMTGKDVFLNFTKRRLGVLSCLFNRNLVQNIGFSETKALSGDFEFILRLCLHGNIGFINKHTAAWRRHEENYSRMVDIETLINNTAYFEVPYRTAIQSNAFDKCTLDKWLKEMRTSYFFSRLIKLHYLAPELIPEFEEAIKQYNAEIYKSVTGDIRLKLFRLISRFSSLTYLIFKYVLNQGPFIRELYSFKRKATEKL